MFMVRVMSALYFFLLALQVVYLLVYKYYSGAIIPVALLRFFVFFCVQFTIFVMLMRTGSGLRLVAHNLQNMATQYEGYDRNGKHLFTFVMQHGLSGLASSTTQLGGHSDSNAIESDAQSEDVFS